MELLFWGTYDTGKPRARILLRGLRENGIKVTECHCSLWTGVEDKSQLSVFSRIRFAWRWLACYPTLVWRFLRLPQHDAVVIGYLGQLDVLVIWLFAKLKRTPIIWDAFLSLHETVVADRKLLHRLHPLAISLYMFEWLGCRAADLVILDTKAHQSLFIEKYRLSEHKVGFAFVGVEPEVFPRYEQKSLARNRESGSSIKVLFYGQCIPLHGIRTIVEAAKILRHKPVTWLMIGQGQEDEVIRQFTENHEGIDFTWKPWVPYQELVGYIHSADMCLGIFGESDKAGRVIPNKAYQVLSCGKPLITRDSEAIRELFPYQVPGILLIPPGEPAMLAQAVLQMAGALNELPADLHKSIQERINPRAVAKQLVELLTTRITG